MAFGLIVVVPVIVLVVHALGLHYHASSDLALLEIRVRDVGSAHTPLVGAYSRFLWNHPGPLLFYVLAPPYRIFGADGAALLAASALVNGLFLVGAALLVWRRGGGAGAALGLVVIMTFTRALGGDFLQSGWNPYMVVVPLLVLVLLVWCVACGDAFLLPVTVGVACDAVQTHLGAAPVALAAVVVASVLVAIDARRGRVRRPVRLVLVSLAVTAVLWIPPVIDATHRRGGNLGELWRYWTASHPDITGWTRAARIVVSQFGIPAPWMTGHERSTPFGGGGLDPSWQVPWALVLLVGAMVVAVRRRDRPAWSLGLLATGLGVIAWVATARVVGEPFGYVVRWMWLVGVITWLAIGWTVMGVLRASVQSPTSRRWGVVVCAVGAAAMSVAATVDATQARPLFSDSARLVDAVQAATVAEARRAPAPVLVESAPGFDSDQAASGILLALDHAGIRAGRDPSFTWQVGSDHVVERSRARTRLVVAANSEVGPYSRDSGYVMVAGFDELHRADRADAEHLRAEVPPAAAGIPALQQWIKDHPRAWKHFHALEARGDRVAVFRAVAP